MQTPEKTIKFVKEWLADPSCKTEGEVKANSRAAYAGGAAYAYWDADAYGAYASYAGC